MILLEQLRQRTSGRRLLILGIGNRLRADDGFGPMLIDRLQGNTETFLLDAGDVPENYLGVIEAAAPEVVLVVDAVDLGAQPGDVALIEIDQLSETTSSTHNASLSLLFKVLKVPDVFIIAVQPRTTAFGAPISQPVVGALQVLEKLFQELAIAH